MSEHEKHDAEGDAVVFRAVSGGVPPLVRADDPILRKRAHEASIERTDKLATALFRVMREHSGAGLAAPQIGEPLRVFVMAGDPLPFVNPVIVERSAETVVQEEGCLSLPGVTVAVRRNVRVIVEASYRRVTLEGIAARVAQHEIDHLDGKLITDYAARVGGVPEQGLPYLLSRLQTARLALGGATLERKQNGIFVRQLDDEEWDKWCDELRAIEIALRAALERPRPALPAPEPPLDRTNFGLLTRAIELLMANEREYSPSNAATDWYLREQRVLALVREVTTRGAALPAEPESMVEDEDCEKCCHGTGHHRPDCKTVARRERERVPAEHAPPDPLVSSVSVMAAKAALAALGDNPALCLAEDPSSIVHALRAAYAVDFGSRPALAGSPDYEALAIEFNQRPLTFSDGIQLSPAAAVREFANWLAGRVSGTQEGTPKPQGGTHGLTTAIYCHKCGERVGLLKLVAEVARGRPEGPSAPGKETV